MPVISTSSPNPAPEIVRELRRQGHQTMVIAVAAILISLATLFVTIVH